MKVSLRVCGCGRGKLFFEYFGCAPALATEALRRKPHYGYDTAQGDRIEEDPTGLLNAGFRYRDLETGSFITRDPLGFVDGPNVYTYVNQNPWSKFDPEGLNETWGGNNWFANWVLPDPKAEYHGASAGSEKMFDSNANVGDRVGGGLNLFGHGIMAVACMIPGEGALEKGFEKGAVRIMEKIAGNETENIERNLVKKGEQLVEKTAKTTGEKAEQEVAKNAPTKAYDVGPANELRANSEVGDKLDVHHAPQSNPAKQTIPGYDPKTAPSIALPEAEHANIPTQKGNATLAPRDQMAKDIKDLRNNTNAPNSSLQKLIKQTKQQYPGALDK